MSELIAMFAMGLFIGGWVLCRRSGYLCDRALGHHHRAMIYTQCAHLVQMDRLEIALAAGAYPRKALQ